MYKGRPAGFDVLDPDTLQTATSAGSSGCKHCSPMYPDYRPINVKVLPMKGRKQDDKFEIVVLEVEASKKKEDDWLPDDFWAFLDGKALHKDRDAKVPLKRVLSPSEVNSLLINSVFFSPSIYLECMHLQNMICLFVGLES